jgi:squalene monooxygenase
MSSQYDILIVGAGVAGSALAHALSQSSVPQRRVALLERSLAEPDRIVGELLQPGGVGFLNKLGLQGVLEGIDAIPEHGYAVFQDGRIVHIPYPDGREGRSFHHGLFVQGLREHAKRAKGVDVIEATVNELLEEDGRVVGVKATRTSGEEKEIFLADLTIIADGCFSNFRSVVQGPSARPWNTKSHFCGVILKNAQLPMPQHGTVALVRGHGPVLLYQISEHDTRMLVDVKNPLPSDLKVCYSVLVCMRSRFARHTSSLKFYLLSPFNYMSRSVLLFLPIAFVACPIHSYHPPLSHTNAVSYFSGTRGTCAIRLQVAV